MHKCGDTPNNDARRALNFDAIDAHVTDEVSFGMYSVEEQCIRLEVIGRTLVNCEVTSSVVVSDRLNTAIADLRALQGLLLSGDFDPRVLSDFRDALNRVRNVAWAAQQSVAAQVSGCSTAVPSLLAAERIRAAYQLCRAIDEDLDKEEIEFQRGQLSELHAAVAELAERLKSRL